MGRARVGVAAVVAVLGARGARAEPQVEASGFVGIASFGASELGNSWAPEQAPHTSALLGARVGWIAVPTLFAAGAARGQLGLEAELAIAPAFTGEAAGKRMSYFAPVFGWHAHALLRIAGWPQLQPHLVIGAGGETIASSSPFMSKETDPVGYWGLGATFRLADRWRFRIDARHGVMADRGDGLTSTFALQAGVSARFGDAPRAAAPPEPAPVVPAPPLVVDSDGDGLLDDVDRCPQEAETKNGIDDDDGCPEADPDGDGVVGSADHCPDQPEDRDGFADDDGCADLDNDGDGFVDDVDVCPDQPETANGITDDDGCPDDIPAALTAALASASTITFEANRARLTDAARATLRPLGELLLTHRGVHIVITAHAARPTATGLARRRADTVKWFLIDAGVTVDRIETAIGPTRKQPIEITLTGAR